MRGLRALWLPAVYCCPCDLTFRGPATPLQRAVKLTALGALAHSCIPCKQDSKGFCLTNVAPRQEAV